MKNGQKMELQKDDKKTRNFTYMVKYVAEALRHKSYVCSLSPYQKVKSNIKKFVLLSLLLQIWQSTLKEDYMRLPVFQETWKATVDQSKLLQDGKIILTVCWIFSPKIYTNLYSFWKIFSSVHLQLRPLALSK